MKCSDDSGEYPIGYLYNMIRGNPENLDDDTIMTACFLRKGVVPLGYDIKQYRLENEGGDFPFMNSESGQAVYRECAGDPLGLINGQ